MSWIRQYLRDCREGARIMSRREFWRGIHDFYIYEMPKRIEAWAKGEKRERH